MATAGSMPAANNRLPFLIRLDQFPYHQPLATKKSAYGGILTLAIYCVVAISFIIEVVRWHDTRYSSKSSTVELDGTVLAAVTDGLSIEVKANNKPFYDPSYFTVQFAANRIEPRSNITKKRARSKVLFDAVPCNDGRNMCPGEPIDADETDDMKTPDGIQGTYHSKHGFQFFTVELRPCYKDFPSKRVNVTVNSTNTTTNATGNATTTEEVTVNTHCKTQEELDAWLQAEGNYVTVSLEFANHLSWTYSKKASIYLNLEDHVWQGVETHFTLTQYKVADNIMADETAPCPPPSDANSSSSSSSSSSVWRPRCGTFLTYNGKDIRRSGGNRLVKFYLKLDNFMRDEVLLPNSLAGIVLTIVMLFMAAQQAVGVVGQELAKRFGVVVPHKDVVLQKDTTKVVDIESGKTMEPPQKCPGGYSWVRERNGWRCKGGSHFKSDIESGRCRKDDHQQCV